MRFDRPINYEYEGREEIKMALETMNIGFEMLSQVDKDRAIEKLGDLIDKMIERVGIEEVWNEAITLGIPDHQLENAKTIANYANLPENRRGAQISQSESVLEAERGQSESLPLSFGLCEPGYLDCLMPHIQRLRDKKDLHTLLLGAQCEQSADEFTSFSKLLNPNSVAVALDLETYGLEGAGEEVKKLQADARELPIKPGSQDIIFTNFLLHSVTINGTLRAGQDIMKILEEAKKALKEGGKMVLMEMTPFFKPSYSMGWFSRILLQKSLEYIGMDRVNSRFVKRYKTQRDKKLKNGEIETETDEGNGFLEDAPWAVTAEKPFEP